jgi:hypothetical protein
MLQNIRNLRKIGRLNTISQISTQNLERHEFSDLPQIKWWKRRSCFLDHVSEVGFEIWSFNISGSRVLDQNPKR